LLRRFFFFFFFFFFFLATGCGLPVMTVLTSRNYKSIVVLTGAGISAASGLRTYRGPDGLWNDPETVRLSTATEFESDPLSYWKFWGNLRKVAAEAVPNEAHLALARWEKTLSKDQKFTLITQNVDELHQRAGSANVVELHGSVYRTRCSNEECTLAPYRDSESNLDMVPTCKLCGLALRPDIVMFGELLPPHAEWSSKRALRDCDLFIAVGTSGTVSPASHFVEWAKYAGARTMLVNLEKMIEPNRSFDVEIAGKAEEVLPTLLK
jgi:NAD-dependent deacetylase